MIKAFKINISSLSALIFKNSILSKNSTTLLKKPDNYILRMEYKCVTWIWCPLLANGKYERWHILKLRLLSKPSLFSTESMDHFQRRACNVFFGLTLRLVPIRPRTSFFKDTIYMATWICYSAIVRVRSISMEQINLYSITHTYFQWRSLPQNVNICFGIDAATKLGPSEWKSAVCAIHATREVLVMFNSAMENLFSFSWKSLVHIS